MSGITIHDTIPDAVTIGFLTNPYKVRTYPNSIRQRVLNLKVGQTMAVVNRGAASGTISRARKNGIYYIDREK